MSGFKLGKLSLKVLGLNDELLIRLALMHVEDRHVYRAGHEVRMLVRPLKTATLWLHAIVVARQDIALRVRQINSVGASITDIAFD